MSQSRGLADSIVAQRAVCADFCNTICHEPTYRGKAIIRAALYFTPEHS
jgi:hypothetical protein